MNTIEELSLADLLNQTSSSKSETTDDGELLTPDPQVEKNELIRKELEEFKKAWRKAMGENGLALIKRSNYEDAVYHSRVGLIRAKEIHDLAAIEYFRFAMYRSYEALLAKYMRPIGSNDRVGSINQHWSSAVAGNARGAIHDSMHYGIYEIAVLVNDYLSRPGVLEERRKVQLEQIENQNIKTALLNLDEEMTQIYADIIKMSDQSDPDDLISRLKSVIKTTIYMFYGSNVWDEYFESRYYFETERRISIYYNLAFLLKEALEKGLFGYEAISYIYLNSPHRQTHAQPQKNLPKNDEQTPKTKRVGITSKITSYLKFGKNN